MLSFVFCEAKMIWKETSFILLSWLRYFLTLIFQCQIFFQRSSLGINHFFFHRVTSRKTKQYQIMNKIFGQGFIKQKPIMQKEGWVLTVFNVFVYIKASVFTNYRTLASWYSLQDIYDVRKAALVKFRNQKKKERKQM